MCVFSTFTSTHGCQNAYTESSVYESSGRAEKGREERADAEKAVHITTQLLTQASGKCADVF